MKAFQAYAKGQRHTAATPRQAAAGFFERFPERRKCDVREGELEGNFFVVRFTLRAGEIQPAFFPGVTKKTASTLPDSEGE